MIYTDLNPAQKALLGYMEGQSEDRWAAGWMSDLHDALVGDDAYDWLRALAGGTFRCDEVEGARYIDANGRSLFWAEDRAEGLIDSDHVLTEGEAIAIKWAVGVLNRSETVGAYEENANWHHASDDRKDIAAAVHVAVVPDDSWKPDEHEPEAYEHGTCTVCNREVTREVRRDVRT